MDFYVFPLKEVCLIEVYFCCNLSLDYIGRSVDEIKIIIITIIFVVLVVMMAWLLLATSDTVNQ